MNKSDRDKLEVIGTILPVMAELRRFYELQFNSGMESLKGIEDPETYKGLIQMIVKESERTSLRISSLSGISWCLIDQVCESLGLAYHEYIKDGHGDS